MRLLLAFLFVFAYTSSVYSKTIHVNNIAGSNTNSGSLAEPQGNNVGPVKSINHALKLTLRGDRIELANTGMPYSECVTLQGPKNSGFSFKPLIIDGNGATLDGSAAVPEGDWSYVRDDIYRFEPIHGGHQVLLLDGGLIPQKPRFDGSYLTTFLQPKEWCRCRGGIHFATESGKSPFNYDLRYAKERVGITLYNVNHVVIENLNVRGYRLDGINAHDNAMECVLAEVTSVANGRSGFAVNGASRVRLVECTAFDNGETQLRCGDWSTSQVINSEFRSEAMPAWTRHVNKFGQGARLFVDDEPMSELQGAWTPREDLPQTDGKKVEPDEGDDAVAPTADQDAEKAETIEINEDTIDESQVVPTFDDETAESDESFGDLPNSDSAVDPSEGEEGEPGLFEDVGDSDPFGDLDGGSDLDEMEEDPFDEF